MDDKKLPPIDFMTFVFSLAASAQVHLGSVPNPSTGKPEKNITLAKQTIDLLGVLEEKTRGNLTPEETELLKKILSDLRLQFLEASK
ncbi:MAG: DUF1844 domain-containing protein [Deltaproteobacteria bacterium]|nr:DUF1844 domain-containing protein [Deltaproteobacteria bacterium]